MKITSDEERIDKILQKNDLIKNICFNVEAKAELKKAMTEMKFEVNESIHEAGKEPE